MEDSRLLYYYAITILLAREVDRAGYIRANLIARFRRGGAISSTKIASLGQDQVKESYNEDDFDIDD